MILDPTATDATLAAHSENGDQLNSVIDGGDDDRLSSASTPLSVNVESQSGAEAIATQIEPIIDHKKDEYDKDPNTDFSSPIENRYIKS